ncbi:lipase family alpha/beta hydrolase [Streptomyces sp. NBC_00872]|uniref:lipase family alpha/beta hydrolase n=1 Tax=Streptomyces sp. NBC_00872 TaxID=2903686 RepID=UPI00386B0E97|nr:alpha/beta hydrolase [Streptomyces sp. NBC_00872]
MSGAQDGKDAKAEQISGKLIAADPLSSEPPIQVPVQQRDTEWELPNGFAWVYYGEGTDSVQKPVIMADGFNLGRSDLQWLAQGLDGGGYKFLSALRKQGRTVILVGFDERTAPIQKNAETVIAAVMRTLGERVGDDRLTVGGFSMGGLVTRYALAKLETQRIDHQTALYFSYDTPHRGAVIPIGLQAFAHFIPQDNAFAEQMNSPAARQMLWRHYDSETGRGETDPLRTELLDDLDRMGRWPQIPIKIAVANGTGDGTGLDVPPGEMALKSTGLIAFPGTTFYTQAADENATVAQLKRLLPLASKTVTTSGYPELDGAPGGTLASYKIVAEELVAKGGKVDLRHEAICFVPTVSAVAIRDIDKQEDLYAKVAAIDLEESELDEIFWSSTTTPHTAITQELCEWIIKRLPN